MSRLTGRARALAVACLLALPCRDAAAQTALSRVADSLIARGFEGVILAGDATGARIGIAHGRARRTPLLEHSEARAWVWASVTKQVTAVLVMMEVERGTLTLASTLADVLPQFRNRRAGAVTIRQLLQHTSGLPNPYDNVPDGQIPSAFRRPRVSPRAIDEANLLCSAGVKRPAGTTFDYNNCDTIVLGAVLEAKTGLPFATLLRTRITQPLGLTSVRMATPGATSVSSISGYDGARPAQPANLATYGAAGALTGTPNDLLQFDLALMGGQLLQPASLAELWQGEPKFGYVALGAWSFQATLTGCEQPVDLVERRGDISGIQVRNLFAPRLGKALIVFTNRGDYEFGELWQQSGATWALAGAAFCQSGG